MDSIRPAALSVPVKTFQAIYRQIAIASVIALASISSIIKGGCTVCRNKPMADGKSRILKAFVMALRGSH
jgi:hypothetical protein